MKYIILFEYWWDSFFYFHWNMNTRKTRSFGSPMLQLK